MTDEELIHLQKCLQFVPDENARDKAIQIVYKAASDSLTLKRLKKLVYAPPAQGTESGASSSKIQFTSKELSKMPDNVKRVLIVNENVVTYRVIKGIYQIRYHRDGYNIEVASKSLDIAKKKFLDKLCEVVQTPPNKFPLFSEFVQTWLSYKKPLIKSSTYDSYVALIEVQLLPAFGSKRINEITRQEIQDFLFGLVNAGKNRTANQCKVLLGAMYDLATDDYEIKNPMKKITLPHYEVKKGSALKREEEKNLVDYCRQHPGTKGTSAVLILMYTGMRFGELMSMTHDDKFIYCISEKTRKGYADVQRKIPISPMLKKVLDCVDLDFGTVASKTVDDFLKQLFPDRHIHELRYTFITRAKECGINTEVVMAMDGHQFDQDCHSSRVDRGYTDFSEEYILKEMLKFDYDL